MHRARAMAVGARIAAYDLLMRGLSLLPLGPAFAIASWVGRRRYRRRRAGISIAHRRNVEQCLSATPREVDQTLERAFALAVCEDLEYALFSRLTRANLSRTIEFRGLDNLDQALAGGRGAILISGHLRGHYLFYAGLGVLGYRPNILGRGTDRDQNRTAQRRFDRRDAVMRDRHGCRFLLMESSNFGVAVKAANALRENGVVTAEIDHTHSSENLQLSFLGRPARFPAGPLLLAQATGAPVMCFFLHRNPGGPQIAEIGPPIEVGRDLLAALQQCVDSLEGGIRRHPASWAPWLFPRWHVWEVSSY